MRVDDADVTAIAEHLGLSAEAVVSRFVDQATGLLKNGFGSRCVFLSDGAQTSCQIYPVRPATCRAWPYWPELSESPAALAAAQRLCPGIVVEPNADRC